MQVIYLSHTIPDKAASCADMNAEALMLIESLQTQTYQRHNRPCISLIFLQSDFLNLALAQTNVFFFSTEYIHADNLNFNDLEILMECHT